MLDVSGLVEVLVLLVELCVYCVGYILDDNVSVLVVIFLIKVDVIDVNNVY